MMIMIMLMLIMIMMKMMMVMMMTLMDVVINKQEDGDDDYGDGVIYTHFTHTLSP